ncbi:MAG: hypothetical protein II147_02945 [Lachnospiraceae bacterium]|nr:hypothetical protein [Lachnospiraceae bacterium]
MTDKMELMGIPFLIAIICLVYGIRLIITRDSSPIRSKDSPVPKDDRQYSLYAGILMIVFALSSVGAAFLLLISREAAIIEMAVSVVGILIAYNLIGKKYGMK